jgi:hypothetical protein
MKADQLNKARNPSLPAALVVIQPAAQQTQFELIPVLSSRGQAMFGPKG